MSVENPTVPLSEATSEMFDGEASASGTRVSRKRALGYSAVWRAVNLIAGDVGRLPVYVLKRNGSGKEVDREHPAYRLLLRKPNDLMTAFTFRQTLQAHALISGNGYAAISRDNAGRPVELMLLDPDQTWPALVGGQLWYVSYVPDSKAKRPGQSRTMIRVPNTDMIHIRGLGFDGLCGYPVLKILRETIGKAIAARDYGARYFRNSARPTVVIEVPAGMSDKAVNNMRESWERMHKGVDNAHRTGILRDGAKLSTLASTARDAQLIENMEFDAREIANVFGVPAHKVGDPSRTAYNSLESENQSYYDDTLDRWLIGHEEEYADKLLTEKEKADDTHVVKFARQELLRTNLSARGEYYSKAINSGWHSADEIRGFEDMNPIPGGFGAYFYRPVNVARVDQPTPAPEPTPPNA